MAPILIYVTLDACALLKYVCLTFKILFNSLCFFAPAFPKLSVECSVAVMNINAHWGGLYVPP